MSFGKRHPQIARWVFLIVLALSAPGCATYSDRIRAAQKDVDLGDYQAAIDELDKTLGVDEDQLPESFGSDNALNILNRATLKQSLKKYKSSSVDFGAADKELDYIDISNDTVGEIGKYIFSDSSTKYEASPIEKLALNGFNLMNYLSNQDLIGASVEARRFTVMRTYLEEADPDSAHAAFASYLAGFTFDQAGQYSTAMRYYDEALQERAFASLHGPVARLSKLTSYRGKKISSFLAKNPVTPANLDKMGDLLVVVSVGRVPYKVPDRMPIGAAIGIAGTYISGNPKVLGYSVFKFVVYPKLIDSPSTFSKATLRVDGKMEKLELASHLGAEVRKDYDALKPKIIGAALSRMITRAAAAEGMRAAGDQQSNALGWVLSLASEASLVALDKPDTRSWIFLPDRVYLYQKRLPAGQHDVEVVLENGANETKTSKIRIPADGYAALVITVPR